MANEMRFFPELHRNIWRFDGEDLDNDNILWTFYGIFEDENGEKLEVWITDGDWRWDIID